MKENVAIEKSYALALKIVRLYLSLKNFILTPPINS
jgi:hypothetical protein